MYGTIEVFTTPSCYGVVRTASFGWCQKIIIFTLCIQKKKQRSVLQNEWPLRNVLLKTVLILAWNDLDYSL